jgi:hypothetical protein
METRGRIAEVTEENRPRQFEYRFTHDDGSIGLWKWDLDINPNGPISTEIFDDGEEVVSEKRIAKVSLVEKFEEPEDNELLPKSKRKYLNPKNGKWVGYTRAYNLGLVK